MRTTGVFSLLALGVLACASGCSSNTRVDGVGGGGTGGSGTSGAETGGSNPGGAATGGHSTGGAQPGGATSGGAGGAATGGGGAAGQGGEPGCGDTSSNPANCGACGHDCLGGSCVAGRCQPVLVAADQYEVDKIIVTDSELYWAGYHTMAVRRCPLTGCQDGPETLASEFGPVVGLAMDATSLYWSVWEGNDGGTVVPGAIRKCVLPACSSPLTLVSGLDQPNQLVLNNVSAFWSAYYDNYIGQVAKGAMNQTLGQEHQLVAGQPQSTSILLHEGALYWSLTGHAVTGVAAIRTCTLPDCTGGATDVVDGLPSVRAMVGAGSTIIWTDTDAGRIFTCDLPACTEGPQVLVDDATEPGFLAADDPELFFTTATGVERCMLPTCSDHTPIAVTEGGPRFVSVGPTAVAYELGGAVYFVAR